MYPDIVVRNGLLNDRHLVVRLWRILNKVIYQRAAFISTLAPQMANLVRQYVCKTSEKKVVVIPTWVDTKRIKPIPKAKNPFAVQHGQEAKLTILYSGNLGITHDLNTLIEVARSLTNHPKLHFIIIGGGVGWELIKEKTAGLSNVTVLPYQPRDILPYSLATGDVSVVTLGKDYNGVSMPSKTYFAMAAGSALLGLSQKGSDIEYVIKKYKCGINVQPDDEKGIRDALLKFASSSEYLLFCKRNARAAAENEFSSEVNIRKVMDLLESMVIS